MQLRQLKYVLEVYRNGFHVSAAAEVLNTSQPGISRQIHLLEEELGFDIFERASNRINGVTKAGGALIKNAEKIFREIGGIQQISGEYSEKKSGRLLISTTHTFARYLLPNTIQEFLQKRPEVQIGLLQGNPTEVCEHVQEGKADIGVTTRPPSTFLRLMLLPILKIKRSILVPKDHPIATLKEITLAELGKYSLLGHDTFRSGTWTVADAFLKEGIMLSVPFAGIHSDVAKTYAGMGLGVAITASVVFDPERDKDLVARDVSHLFPDITAYAAFRKSSFLRDVEMEFMLKLSPDLTRQKIRTSREESFNWESEDVTEHHSMGDVNLPA